MKSCLTRFALVAGLAATPLSTLAQDQSGIHAFVHVAARLHAGAIMCCAYSTSELNELRNDQRDVVMELDLTAKEFDEMFDAAYKDAEVLLAGLSKAEKEEICEELEETPVTEWR